MVFYTFHRLDVSSICGCLKEVQTSVHLTRVKNPLPQADTSPQNLVGPFQKNHSSLRASEEWSSLNSTGPCRPRFLYLPSRLPSTWTAPVLAQSCTWCQPRHILALWATPPSSMAPTLKPACHCGSWLGGICASSISQLRILCIKGTRPRVQRWWLEPILN